jgi:hypothetical protein
MSKGKYNRKRGRTPIEEDPTIESESLALNHGAWLAIHGVISYDDIFHVRHFTKVLHLASGIVGAL